MENLARQIIRVSFSLGRLANLRSHIPNRGVEIVM